MDHILSIDQFDRQKLETIFHLSAQQDNFSPKTGHMIFGEGSTIIRKTLATAFFEPSTRTRLSFESAFIKLGGEILSIENAFDNSSNAKGESFLDTIRTISNYADFVVFRHPEPNSASEASKVSNCPIINAGDGDGEHPTQAILDLYTIWKEKGQIDGLKIGILGDLKKARTINSFKRALKHFDVEIFEFDNFAWTTQKELEEYKSKLIQCDVVYLTRYQVERHAGNFSSPNIFLNANYKPIKEDAIVLHPLPRGPECSIDFDGDPRAKYWDQVKNGIAVRQALILALSGYIKL